MIIRRAEQTDIDFALGAMSAAFDLQLRAPTVHTLVADSPDGILLVGEREQQVVGTAASVGFGPTGWLGGITVLPEARGSGLGRALTEAAIDALGERETVLLLASALGRPIYEKLGFVAEDSYRVFIVDESAPATFPEADPARVRELDRRATGEDRSLVLDVSRAYACRDAVALVPPWPALAVVGGPDGAEELVRGLVRPGMRVSAPESNPAACALLASLGTERAPVVRMRRGPAVQWRPSEVWGVFSLFFG